MGKSKKEATINSFIFSNLNYYHLEWHFSSCESIRKILKRLKNAGLEIQRLRTLAVEIFKILNEINPRYMKNIVTPNEISKVWNNIMVNRINTRRFGNQSLRSLGPKIWHNLPSNIKSETSFPKFKEYIKTSLVPGCRCKVCINIWTGNVF